MNLFSLFAIAVGLSMDAFAVSVCKGLAMRRLSLKNTVIIGLWFGGFQALMPLLGYFLGSQFQRYITSIDHWIAFALLALIGISMIREALSKEEESINDSVDFRNMLVLDVSIVPAVSFIGIITFTLSMAGVKVGNLFGMRYKSRAELAGGIILICIGLEILLEHLGILP